MMKSASSDADHALSSIGTDLGTMGLDMSFNGYALLLPGDEDEDVHFFQQPILDIHYTLG